MKILAHLKLPIEADGFLPIQASPWDDPSAALRACFGWAYATNDDAAADDHWPIDLADNHGAA